MSVLVRLAEPSDAAAICAIYNHAVRTSTATLETEERSLEAQQTWLAQHDGNPYPCFVAEEAGAVLGWASLSRYNPKPGYRATAENSVYVAHDAQGKGVGRALLTALLDDAPQREIYTILALITSDNAISIHLHERLGFRTVGTLERVGKKFGRTVDVTILQKHVG